jgi:hypothetical protein
MESEGVIRRSAREGINKLESNLSISSAIYNFLISLRPNSSRVEFDLSEGIKKLLVELIINLSLHSIAIKYNYSITYLSIYI